MAPFYFSNSTFHYLELFCVNLSMRLPCLPFQLHFPCRQATCLSRQCYIPGTQNKAWHTVGSLISAKLNFLTTGPCPRPGPGTEQGLELRNTGQGRSQQRAKEESVPQHVLSDPPRVQPCTSFTSEAWRSLAGKGWGPHSSKSQSSGAQPPPFCQKRAFWPLAHCHP